jgi:hypothetical protein
MRFRSLAIVSLAAVAISPPLVFAQEALPYSAGQWGLEASVSPDPEGGVLRFLSPKTAVVLSGSYYTLSTKDKADDPFFGTFTTKTSQSLAAVRLGVRFFRPIATSLVQFTTIGATAQHISEERDDPISGAPLDVRLTNLGAFGELGVQYHFAPRFAVGTAFRAEYLHVSGKTTGSGPDVKTTGDGFALDFMPIRASIFF